MKFLKKFNENKGTLLDFCDNYLAYLKDDGFIVDIGFSTDKPANQITISKKGSGDDKLVFDSSEVIDVIIPFIEVLKENYSILDDKIYIKFWDDVVGTTLQFGYEYSQKVSNFLEDFDQYDIIHIRIEIKYK